MGVAGQIFAARVAIGLAVPSPKALSQTGQMLGNFSKKMYKKLNGQHLQAAQERSNVTTQELQRANARISEFQKRSQSELMASAQRSLNRTNKMFSGQVASSSRQVQQMKTSMGRVSPAMAPKLFANINKDMQSGAKYQKIMHNFISLTQTERKVVLDGIKITLADSKARAARTVIAATENVERHEEALVQVEDAQRLENTYEQMQILDRERFREKSRLAQEHKNLLNDQSSARKKSNEALQQQTKFTNEMIAAQEKLNHAMQKAVFTMKEVFGEVLRDSISILAGFYYKLNEATEGLVVFEKELLNANSVFNLTRDELFKTSQSIVQFGQEFGLAMDNGAAGLYQLASAGLSADEAIKVLPHTLKLSMAVMGDHNTISKLTAQTLFGFGMEMEEAGLLTDKFAHAIQKSLIEYEDLTSAIKFALPFFTATGQSIDQLLGSLQVLTNRALEAGIAGRGLRQALAEFAESAEDNAIALGKMGVNILDANGEMLQLTDIAQNFADIIGPEMASNTELLTALIQELNVRGATAFIHLVQNVDEFKQAVEDTTNAGGELDQMVRIQNESISSQIQILKNNVQAIFFMRDATDDGTGALNEFHQGVLDVIASLRGLIVEELSDGSYALTEFGHDIRKIAVQAVQLFGEAVENIVVIIRDFSKAGFLNISMLKAYFTPIAAVLKVIQMLGPNIIKMALWWKVLNAILPVSTLLILAEEVAVITNTSAKIAATAATTALSGAEHALHIHAAEASAALMGQIPIVATTASGMGTAAASTTAFAAAQHNAHMHTAESTLAMNTQSGALVRLGRALINPYVIALAVTAAVAYLVLRTMDLKKAWEGLMIGAKDTLNMMKFAVTPLTELFGEWGDSVERVMASFGLVGDNRSFMITMMQEMGSVVALMVYGISEVIARVFRFIVEIGEEVVDFVLGDNILKMIDMVKTIQSWQGMPGVAIDLLFKAPETDTGDSGSDEGFYNSESYGADWNLGNKVGKWGDKWNSWDTGIGNLENYGLANGGQIQGYANGGPILVGERGPELFVPPRMGGQVLNSDRTRNLLRGQTGMSNGNGMINTLIVQNLQAANSISNNSKIAVDTFAGVV